MTEIKVKKEDVLKAYEGINKSINVLEKNYAKGLLEMLFPEAFEEEKKEVEGYCNGKRVEPVIGCLCSVCVGLREKKESELCKLIEGIESNAHKGIIMTEAGVEIEAEKIRDLAIKKVDECYVDCNNNMNKTEGLEKLEKM